MDLLSKTSSIHYFWASSTSFMSRFHSEWFLEKNAFYHQGPRYEFENMDALIHFFGICALFDPHFSF